MGNGPSLNEVNIEDIRSVDTFSVNGAYVSYPEWGFNPTYHVMIDGNSIRFQLDEIKDLVRNNKKISHFFYNNYPPQFDFGDMENDPRVSFITGDRYKKYDGVTKGKWANNIPKYINDLHIITSVVPFTIQLAINLGYDKIGLVGVDVRYVKREDVAIDGKYKDGYLKGKNRVVFTSDNDPNHYRKDYHGTGHYTALKNIDGVVGNDLEPYKSIAEVAKSKGVELISCTKNSRANGIFKYSTLDTFLN
jgi:hypothetical protein